jgi:hypothetical protein
MKITPEEHLVRIIDACNHKLDIGDCDELTRSGLLSTIAAIRGLVPVIEVNDKAGFVEVWQMEIIRQIREAWPLRLMPASKADAS